MGFNDLLSLGYKRRGEVTEWGIAFAEDEVLPDCDHSPSPLSLCFSADSGGCLCFVESPCASSIAPLRCLHACVFLCVHVSQRISAYRLTGCILDHLIYCLIHCSFSVVSSLWPSARSSAMIPYYSSLVLLFLGSGPPWSHLGSSYACRITRHRFTDYSADSGGCLCFVERSCASSRAPSRCLRVYFPACACASCECVGVGTSTLTGSPVVFLTI